MHEPENILEVAKLRPDYMGFIFFAHSKRNALDINPEIIKALPEGITRVAVFVDSTADEILEKTSRFEIKTLQLHGNESPELCKVLKNEGYVIIKAISIDDKLPEDLDRFVGNVDFFLFDTSGTSPGGNGIKFDWKALNNYKLKIPFFLSGGIDPQDTDQIIRTIPKECQVIDINSRFEDYPGHKNIDKLNAFINKLRSKQ